MKKLFLRADCQAAEWRYVITGLWSPDFQKGFAEVNQSYHLTKKKTPTSKEEEKKCNL